MIIGEKRALKKVTDKLSRRDKKEIKRELGISGKRLRVLQKRALRSIADREQISKRTLQMIDSSMENFAKGIVGDPIDTEELRRIDSAMVKFAKGTDNDH